MNIMPKIKVYGLFFDCAPYLYHRIGGNQDLLSVMTDKQIFTPDKAKIIRRFIAQINALRTMYCHNASMEDYQNYRLNCDAMNFFNEGGTFRDLSLTEKEWAQHLQSLQDSAIKWLEDIRQGLGRLAGSLEKEAAARLWIQCIIRWYCDKPFFFNSALDEVCKFKMLQNGIRNPNPENSLWRNYRSALARNCGDWKTEIGEFVMQYVDQVYPYNVLIDYIQSKQPAGR